MVQRLRLNYSIGDLHIPNLFRNRFISLLRVEELPESLQNSVNTKTPAKSNLERDISVIVARPSLKAITIASYKNY